MLSLRSRPIKPQWNWNPIESAEGEREGGKKERGGREREGGRGGGKKERRGKEEGRKGRKRKKAEDHKMLMNFLQLRLMVMPIFTHALVRPLNGTRLRHNVLWKNLEEL